MVGLGEETAELLEVFRDLAAVHCDILTIGQYLRPSKDHLPMARLYTPKEFADIFADVKIANTLGFDNITSTAFEAQLNALRAPVFMVPGGIECGHYPDKTYVSICGDSASMSSYTGGKWVLGSPIKTVTFTP